MQETAKNTYKKVKTAMHTRRGQDFLVFFVFLFISTILWFVMTLNDEVQSDIRMPFEVTNIPDSVTLVSTPPSEITVSVRTRSTQRLRMAIGQNPTFKVDFREFQNGKSVRLSSADLKNTARNLLDGSTIHFVAPDSLNILYTTSKGQPMPVVVDYEVSPASQFSVRSPKVSVDTVQIFTADGLPASVSSVYTEPIRYNNIKETIKQRVRLVAPAGTRVIPDSLDITFVVEPLILKKTSLTVETINVPDGYKLITFPAKVEVSYMVPMGEYSKAESSMSVVVDYNTIDSVTRSRNIRLQFKDIPESLKNVRLAADSVEYIIEKL